MEWYNKAGNLVRQPTLEKCVNTGKIMRKYLDAKRVQQSSEMLKMKIERGERINNISIS